MKTSGKILCLTKRGGGGNGIYVKYDTFWLLVRSLPVGPVGTGFLKVDSNSKQILIRWNVLYLFGQRHNKQLIISGKVRLQPSACLHLSWLCSCKSSWVSADSRKLKRRERSSAVGVNSRARSAHPQTTAWAWSDQEGSVSSTIKGHDDKILQ